VEHYFGCNANGRRGHAFSGKTTAWLCRVAIPPATQRQWNRSIGSKPLAPTLIDNSSLPTFVRELFLVWHHGFTLDLQQGQSGPTSEPSSAQRHDNFLQPVS
jgi:hypothetical protein